MSIRLQFVGSKSASSHLIEWFSAGDVSHVDAVLPDGQLLGARNDELGDIPAGVQVRPPNYGKWEKVVRVELPADEGMEKEFLASLLREVGKPYDREAIFGFIVGRNWHDPRAWFCSELIGAKLEECGWFPYPLLTPSNKLTPAGLLLAISARTRVDERG